MFGFKKSGIRELTAREGLLCGWCLAHDVSPRNIKRNWLGETAAEYWQYQDTLRKLLAWCPMIGPDRRMLSFRAYRKKVYAAFKADLECTSRMSRKITPVYDMEFRASLIKERVGRAEAFSLIARDEAIEIEFLGGASRNAEQSQENSSVSYRPDILPAWASVS